MAGGIPLLTLSLVCSVLGLLTFGLPCIVPDLLAMYWGRSHPAVAGTWLIRSVRSINLCGFLIGVSVSRRLYQFPGE